MWDCLTRKPGVSVSERGTLQELYENINADIEEALPLLDDAHLKHHLSITSTARLPMPSQPASIFISTSTTKLSSMPLPPLAAIHSAFCVIMHSI